MKRLIIFSTIIITSVSTSGQSTLEKLSLDQCIQMALQNNPSLQKSNLALEQSRISVKQSYSNLYPSMNISTSFGQKTDLPGSDWSYSRSIDGSIHQNLFYPGLFTEIRLNKLNEQISEISMEDVHSQLRTDVENIYFNILTSEALISVYEENIKVAEENIKKTRAMYKLGARTESDVLKSEVQKGDFETQLLNERQNLLSHKRALNILMGRNPDTPFEIEVINVDNIEIPDYENAKEILLNKNRELNILRQEQNAQNLSLRMAKESYLPSISGSYSYSDHFNGDLADASNRIGLSASINLFEGFRRKQTIQREKINVKNVNIQLDEKKREVEQTLLAYYSAIDTYNNLIKIHEKSLESAQKDFELVTRQYQIGFSTILDQMNAHISVLKSQSILIKAKYSRKIIESLIRHLLGC